jgi:ribonucleoside-triphosphate reductase
MKDDYLFPDGTTMNLELVQKIQELFIQIFVKELERTPITFPIQTACFSVDTEGNVLDEEFAKLIARYNKSFGHINIYCGSSSTLSSCCRLRSDKENEYFNSFGSGSSKIGSLGVVTINLPKLAFKHEHSINKDDFYKELRELVVVCARVNNAKRKIVQKRIDSGNHPLYSYGFIDLSTQYSTVGINGFNECIEILGHDILTTEGQELGLKIIHTMNDENDKCAKLYKMPHNCEQIPAESVSVKLADKDRFLKINNRYELYSNQFIPLTTNADMLDRIKLQGLFDKHFSGGAIAHINVDTQIEDEQQIVDLIKTCAKMGVVYWAINYNLQECANGHIVVGKGDNCTICNSEIVNNYTRVVGFLTNVKNWNKTRREVDFPNRQFYSEV